MNCHLIINHVVAILITEILTCGLAFGEAIGDRPVAPPTGPNRMIDRTPPTARQDGDRMVLSVAEAAAHLGVTPDAVRARLHRGTLFGVKDAGEWRIYLDHPERRPTGSPTGASPVGRTRTPDRT